MKLERFHCFDDQKKSDLTKQNFANFARVWEEIFIVIQNLETLIMEHKFSCNHH